jgi:hypothetical protein
VAQRPIWANLGLCGPLAAKKDPCGPMMVMSPLWTSKWPLCGPWVPMSMWPLPGPWAPDVDFVGFIGPLDGPKTLGCSKLWSPTWAHMGPIWAHMRPNMGPTMGPTWSKYGPNVRFLPALDGTNYGHNVRFHSSYLSSSSSKSASVSKTPCRGHSDCAMPCSKRCLRHKSCKASRKASSTPCLQKEKVRRLNGGQ